VLLEEEVEVEEVEAVILNDNLPEASVDYEQHQLLLVSRFVGGVEAVVDLILDQLHCK
jgi:hypothetical protein